MSVPLILQIPPIFANDLEGFEKRRNFKPCGKDDGVEIRLCAALTDNALLRQPLNALRAQLHVLTVQRCEISWVIDAPLTTQGEFGYNEAMILLGGLAVYVLSRLLLYGKSLTHLALVGSIHRGQLICLEEQVKTMVPLPKRQVAEAKFVEAGEDLVRSRVVPLGAPGVLRQTANIRSYRGHHLRRAAPVSNNCYPFVGVVKRVIPLGGMEDCALVLVHARELGPFWLREATHS